MEDRNILRDLLGEGFTVIPIDLDSPTVVNAIGAMALAKTSAAMFDRLINALEIGELACQGLASTSAENRAKIEELCGCNIGTIEQVTSSLFDLVTDLIYMMKPNEDDPPADVEDFKTAYRRMGDRRRAFKQYMKAERTDS